MQKASENKDNSPRRLSGYSSSKMIGLTPQQPPPQHFTAFPQETPMKPSQVPNRLSHPSLRRLLPLQTHGKESLHPHLHHPGRVAPNNPPNAETPLSKEAGLPKDCVEAHRLVQSSLSSPLHTTEREQKNSLSGSKHLSSVPAGHNSGGSVHVSSHGFSHRSTSLCPHKVKDRPPSGHAPKHQESKVTTASNNTRQRHDPLTRHHHHHKTSSGNNIPEPFSSWSSLKRRRESEYHQDDAKKPCPAHSSRMSDSSLASQPAMKNSTLLESSNRKATECTERKPGETLQASSSKHCTSKAGMKETSTSFSEKKDFKSVDESRRRCEKNHKRHHSGNSDVLQKVFSKSRRSGSLDSRPAYLPYNKTDPKRESRKTEHCSFKSPSNRQSFHAAERYKTSRRKPATVPDDIEQLFTPDPIVVSPVCKSETPKINADPIKFTGSQKTGAAESPTSSLRNSPSTADHSDTPACKSTTAETDTEKASSPASSTKAGGSSTAHLHVSTFVSKTSKENDKTTKLTLLEKKSSTSASGLSNGHKAAHATATDDSSTKYKSPTCLPSVTLKLVKLEQMNLGFKDRELKNISTMEYTLVKSEDKQTSHICIRAAPLPDATPASSSEKQAHEGVKKDTSEEGSIDGELDLDQNFECNLDLTQSSDSSEEENLITLQEIMKPLPKILCTPEKGTFSEPSTPGHHSSQSKSLPSSAVKSIVYKNNLDEMMKEMTNNKKAKEIEAQLLTAYNEDLFRIPDSEEMEENQEEGISTEQQEFLQRYSLMSTVTREVPPGEEVFHLERFGCIFNQNMLQLRQCMVNPQTSAQKALLWSSPAQLRLHVNIGLFQEAYDLFQPCPAQVTHFLFKMMSVHNERMVSEKILHILCDIACSAAYQISKNGSHRFKVWVPSLADVTLVLMNMGVGFVTLFPFENLQPPFTERDLLENDFVKPESPSENEDHVVFHEYNYINVLKYLSYCMGLCPHTYSDNELLLLLSVVEKVSLDTRCILQSSVDVNALLYKIVNNIRDWDAMLPRICVALTDLTEDHQNMCLLVQLLPDHTRGKELRRHLSLCMISKLLEGNCTYQPTQTEFQLAELRPYLPRMQPSALLRSLQQKNPEEDFSILDQQAYYLCYSLLTLANEASNFQVFPPHQKAQLLVLSSELEARIKCDIRESEKCLYRSKLKDLVARIYTKWQMLLQRTRPLNGKLYDYWEPVEIISSCQEAEECPVDDEMDAEDQGSLSADEDEGSTTSEEEEKIEAMTVEVQDAEPSQTSDNEGDGRKNDTETIEKAATESPLQTVEEEEMH